MATGYRAILRQQFDHKSLDLAIEILADWVKSKGFPGLPLVDDHLSNDSGSVLSAQEFTDGASNLAGYRWKINENWAAPKWYKNEFNLSRAGETRISLIFSADYVWLWVEIEPPQLRYVDNRGLVVEETQWSGTPRFIGEFLRKVEMRDGRGTPAPGFRLVVDEEGVRDLIGILEDPDRFGTVYVAAVPQDMRDDEWVTQLEDIVGPIEGMGFGFLLTRDALRYFNDRVEYGHAVPAGSMRTFQTGARLYDNRDAPRHRLLHAGTISRTDPKRLNRILRSARISRLRQQVLPPVLLNADYRFMERERALNIQRFQGIKKRPISPAEAGALENRKENEELIEMLMQDNDKLHRRNVSVENDMSTLIYELDLVTLEKSSLQDEVEQNRRQIKYLQSQLRNFEGEAASAADSFFAVPDAESLPETFQELIDRIETFKYVRFFGDRSKALDLDLISDLGSSAVFKAWNALVTFESYCAAKVDGQYSKSLRMYVDVSDHGFPQRISDVAWSESESVRTNSSMLAERTVRGLPEAISPTGEKAFLAHIRLANRAGYPRLYFEDTFSQVGFVSVGTIGVHLTNTLTN